MYKSRMALLNFGRRILYFEDIVWMMLSSFMRICGGDNCAPSQIGNLQKRIR